MASFTDIRVRYSGANPFAIIRLAFEECTISLQLIVEYADKDYVVLKLEHCNDEYLNICIEKMKAYATLSDADIEIENPIKESE